MSMDSLRDAAIRVLLAKIDEDKVSAADLIKLLSFTEKGNEGSLSSFDFEIRVKDDE